MINQQVAQQQDDMMSLPLRAHGSAQQQVGIIPQPRPRDDVFILDMASKFPRDHPDGVLFGGCVRDILNNEPVNDYDVAMDRWGIQKFQTRLANSHRIISRRSENLDLPPNHLSGYPVTKMVIDTPRTRDVGVDLVATDSVHYKTCDFTCNNLVQYPNGTIGVRVCMEGRTRQMTLAICLNDALSKKLRFMMPDEMPFVCRKAERYDHCPPQRPVCVECKRMHTMCSVKLVKRLLHMEKKGYTLAEHPNFPPYFPRSFRQHKESDEHVLAENEAAIEREKMACSLAKDGKKLSKGQRKRLRKKQKKSARQSALEEPSQAEIDEDVCPICFEPGKPTVTTKCGHAYCVDCTWTMVVNNGSRESCCPLCRGSFEFEGVEQEDIEEEEQPVRAS